MTWRFRKRIKVLPGVHLNIGKRGISTSIGVRGASVTIGKGRTTASAGIPGTGLGISRTVRTPAGAGQSSGPQRAPAPAEPSALGAALVSLFAFVVWWCVGSLAVLAAAQLISDNGTWLGVMAIVGVFVGLGLGIWGAACTYRRRMAGSSSAAN